MNWHRTQRRLAVVASKQALNAPPPKAPKPSNRYQRMMARRKG